MLTVYMCPEAEILAVPAQKSHNNASIMGRFAKQYFPVATSFALFSDDGRCAQRDTRIKIFPIPGILSLIGFNLSGDLFSCLFLNVRVIDCATFSVANSVKFLPISTWYFPSVVTTLSIFEV